MLVTKNHVFHKKSDILHTVECAIGVTSGNGRLTYRKEGGGKSWSVVGTEDQNTGGRKGVKISR